MKNVKHIIQAKPLPNGYWGIPRTCKEPDTFFKNLDKDKRKLHTALCMMLYEKYPTEVFEIRISNNAGFCAFLPKSGITRLNYKDYELDNNKILIKNGN